MHAKTVAGFGNVSETMSQFAFGFLILDSRFIASQIASTQGGEGQPRAVGQLDDLESDVLDQPRCSSHPVAPANLGAGAGSKVPAQQGRSDGLASAR